MGQTKRATKKTGRKPPAPRAPAARRNTSPDGVDFFNAEQAADACGVSMRAIIDAVRDGELGGTDFGGSVGVRTTREALNAWIDRGRARAPDAAPAKVGARPAEPREGAAPAFEIATPSVDDPTPP